MLKGQAKTDYQREYMRRRRLTEALETKRARSNAIGMGLLDPSVRPIPKPSDKYILSAIKYLDDADMPIDNRRTSSELDADGNVIYKEG